VHLSKGGANPKQNSKAKLKWSWLLYQVLLVYFLIVILLEISIIKFLLYWFSSWGFFQGHVDQKYLCINLWFSYFLISIKSGKYLEGICCFEVVSMC
jgi:hypothetical protein